MSYLLFMFCILLAGMVVLVGGMMLINRDVDNSPYGLRSSFKSYVVWGAGFFVAFASEFSILAYF